MSEDAHHKLHIMGYRPARAFLEGPDAGKVTHILSFGDPGSNDLGSLAGERTLLRLEFYDVDVELETRDDPQLPGRAYTRQIMDFLDRYGKHSGAGDLLIHCHAGVSRSTAAGLIYLYLRTNPRSEARAVEHLLEITEDALPNRTLLTCADEILGSNLRGSAVELARLRRARFIEEFGFDPTHGDVNPGARYMDQLLNPDD
jgi:predicted protein tyrosine phosphatase